jgi:hypothetical protein
VAITQNNNSPCTGKQEGTNYFLLADETPGMWKVVGHFFAPCEYSDRMGIGKGRALPVYFVDAVREGAFR